MIAFLVAGVCYPYTAQAQCDFPATTTLRVLLEGPLDTTTMLMNDELRTAGLLPLAEPYTALGHQFRGGGNETIDPSVLLPEGPDAIVDWVVVEVRHPNDPGRILYSRSALLQRDGDVVGLDGLNSVQLCVEAGKYHIAVRHRNHLGIMTGSPLEYYQGQFGILYSDPVDLSSPQTNTYRNSQARRKMGVGMAMWSGDVSFDGKVQYTGEGNDRDLVLQAIGGVVPTSTATGYGSSDLNLDGSMRYTGDGNDRDQILRTIGGAVPTNIREGYLPKDSLTLRPNVHVVDTLDWVLDMALSDLDSNTVMVYLLTVPPPILDIGHIVVGWDPNGGYLRRITSYSISNDTLMINTEQAGLADVFASGQLLLELVEGQGEQQRSAMRSSTYFNSQIPLPFNGASFINVRVEDLSVIASSKPTLDLNFGTGGLESGEVGLKDISIGVSYNLKIEGSVGVDSLEIPLVKNYPIYKSFIIVSGIPILYDIVLNLSVTGKIEFQGAVNTTTYISNALQANATSVYTEATGWSDNTSVRIGEPSITTDVNSATIGAKASVGIAPEIMVKLYKSPGGLYGSLGPEMSATLRASTGIGDAEIGDYDLKVEGKMKGKLGVKAKILDRYKFDRGWVWESDPFVSFNTPYRADTNQVSGNHQIAHPEDSLPLPLRVHVDSRLAYSVPFSAVGDTLYHGAPIVPVNFEVLSGGGTLSSTRVYTDLDGNADTYWTLGPGLLSDQVVRAWIMNGVGDTIPSSVIFRVDSLYHLLQAVSAISQAGHDNTPLLQDVRVRVLEQPSGEPVNGQEVRFEIISGGGWLSEAIVTTDAAGEAATSWSLPTEIPTPQIMRAFVLSQTGDTISPGPINFTAEYGPPFISAVFSGGSNSGTAGSTKWIEVDLGRSWGADPQLLTSSPLSGRLVQFQCNLPDGSVTNQGSVSTAPDGTALFPFTLPAVHGEGSVTAFHVNTMGDTVYTSLPYYVCDACPATVTDIDGNSYPVVNIGCKCWMAKNLQTTKFKNGDPIAQGTNIPFNANDTIWGAFNDRLGPLNAPARGAKHFVASNVGTYGWLYNGWVIDDPRGVCPAGWRVPSGVDFEQLIAAAGGDSLSGPGLRSNSGLWNVPPLDYAPWSAQPHRDTYGFNLLPGGSIPHWCCPNTNPCCLQTEGEFLQEVAGEDAYLWTSDRRFAELGYTYYYMDLSSSAVSLSSGTANSCRCVMGE